jgi:hypothetical protein
MQAEAVVLNYLRGGNPTAKGLGEARAESKRMMSEIEQRVKRHS